MQLSRYDGDGASEKKQWFAILMVAGNL